MYDVKGAVIFGEHHKAAAPLFRQEGVRLASISVKFLTALKGTASFNLSVKYYPAFGCNRNVMMKFLPGALMPLAKVRYCVSSRLSMPPCTVSQFVTV